MTKATKRAPAPTVSLTPTQELLKRVRRGYLPTKPSASTQGAVYRARDALIRALFFSLEDELSSLINIVRSLGSEARPTVEAWLTEHRLRTDWLIERLTVSIVSSTDLASLRAALLIPLAEERRRGPAAVLADFKPPTAHPTEETQAEYLARAAEHYRFCKRMCEAYGYDAVSQSFNKSNLNRDTDWLVSHRVGRESYGAIAIRAQVERSVVEKAIGRLAELLELKMPQTNSTNSFVYRHSRTSNLSTSKR